MVCYVFEWVETIEHKNTQRKLIRSKFPKYCCGCCFVVVVVVVVVVVWCCCCCCCCLLLLLFADPFAHSFHLFYFLFFFFCTISCFHMHIAENVTFLEMDASNMTFASNHFDLIIDKGLLDPLVFISEVRDVV